MIHNLKAAAVLDGTECVNKRLFEFKKSKSFANKASGGLNVVSKCL